MVSRNSSRKVDAGVDPGRLARAERGQGAPRGQPLTTSVVEARSLSRSTRTICSSCARRSARRGTAGVSGASDLAVWQALRSNARLDPQETRSTSRRRVERQSGARRVRRDAEGASQHDPKRSCSTSRSPVSTITAARRVERRAHPPATQRKRHDPRVRLPRSRFLALVDYLRSSWSTGRVAYDGPGRETDHDITLAGATHDHRRFSRTAHDPHRARSADSEITFLRLVPGDSFVHRLWAGTKLIVAAELALTASVSPTWFSLGVLAGLVLLGLVLSASVPLSAFPRLPLRLPCCSWSGWRRTPSRPRRRSGTSAPCPRSVAARSPTQPGSWRSRSC